MMNALTKTFGCLAAAAILTSGAVSMAADKNSDALRAAPPAVQVAVVKLVGANKIDEFGTEVDDGKTIYDLEFTIKGVSYAADIDLSGNILAREVDVDLAVVPPAVIAAATKAHADGKIGESSVVTEGEKMFYGLDVKVGKDTHEMKIGANGTVIADTVAAPEAPATPDAAAKAPAAGAKAPAKAEEKD